jgi:hypothetical protein
VALETRGPFTVGLSVPLDAEVVFSEGDRGVARCDGTLASIGRKTGAVAVDKEDYLRTMGVRYNTAGERDRPFGEAVSILSETPFKDFPLKGPRTMRWLLLAHVKQNTTPVARHFWWRQVQRLSANDVGVEDHLFLAEMFETAVCFDQLQVGELAVSEAAARRFQLWEEVYASSLMDADAGHSGAVHLDERALFLGRDSARGAAMVCPELEAWIASELQTKSAVLKERRKAREERVLARGGGGADEGGPSQPQQPGKAGKKGAR